MNYEKQKLIILSAILIIVCFGFGKEVSADTYFATGTLISTNLLSGKSVGSIDSFFTSSTIPNGTSLSVQFATTSTSGPWYDASSTLNATTSISTAQATTTLSGAICSGGANFYYKMQFNSNAAQDAAPVLDEIRVNYTLWTAEPPTYTLATTTGKTIRVHNNLVIGDGTNKVIVTGLTNNPTLDIDGNLTINTNSTLIAPSSSAFTIAGDWSNSGTFTHSDGTVTFDTASVTSTISDSNTFYNLNCTTSDKNIVFEEGATTTVAGTLTLTGASGQEIILRSSSSTAWWYLTAQATNTVSYVNVKDSNASSSAVAIDDTTGGIDSGNNPNWLFPAAKVDISGNVYTNEGQTTTTDTSIIALAINDSKATTTSISNGSYKFTGQSIYSSDIVTVFWDTDGGNKAVTVTKGISASTSDFHLYQNRVIIRQEGASALTISDMDKYDNGQDQDVLYTATTSPSVALSVDANAELYIWPNKEFAPGGNVTLDYGGSGDEWNGSLKITTGATFTATGTESHSIGGNWFASSTATFTAANSTVTFTATTTGKTIDSGGSNFFNVTFDDSGEGGGWEFITPVILDGNLQMIAGELYGTSNITIKGGNLDCGVTCGTINLTNGTTTLESTGYFGSDGLSPSWTFFNLTFGDGSTPATTTSQGTGTTTISNILTINNNHTLNAGEKIYNLRGGGIPFVKTGIFTPVTSTVQYTASGTANITAATYYNLESKPSGVTTHTLGTEGSQTITVNNNLEMGDGSTSATTTAATYNPSLIVKNNLIINSSVIFVAPPSSDFKVGGDWSNSGTFTHSSGTVIFDSSSIGKTINSGGIGGNKAFYDINFDNASGGWTFSASTTVANDFTITQGFVTSTSGILYVGGDWYVSSTAAIFKHNSGTVLFDTTTTGKTITDGGWPFYLLTFNGENGEWLYQDSTSTAPATTTVQAGTPTFLNAKTGAVSVTDGELLVDWYLGGHIIDKDYPAYYIDTGDNDITISEATASSTVWKWDGSNWLGPYNSTTTGSLSDGKIPHPATTTAGAIKIREYSKTAATTIFYKYNLEIDSQLGFDLYDYYTDYEGKYITSTLSPEENEDRVISQNWHRSVVSLMNEPYTCPGGEGDQCINQPPTNGSWYIGMSSVLEFTVTPGEVELILNLDNYFTATTGITLSATTSHPNGFIVKAHMADTEGELTTLDTEKIERFQYNNDSPGAWNDICNASSTQCGFGYTTNDSSLPGEPGDRFTTPISWAGFATSSETTDPVATGQPEEPYGESYLITLKTSVNFIQLPDSYTGTIVFICTVNY